MSDYTALLKKVRAAEELLNSSSTSIQKLKSVQTLLTGTNPKLDALLKEYGAQLAVLESVEKGDVIQLSAQSLPEETEEEKKKKRVLLLFLKSWEQLKEEVIRVRQEIEASTGAVSTWGTIFSRAKGPLAVITIVAIGIVLASQASSKVTIHNDGCDSFVIGDSVPVSIPRFVLSADSIPTDESAIATLPPLTVTVDGTAPGALRVSTTGFDKSFSLSDDVRDIAWNDSSLIGANTEIRLAKQKNNELTITCGT